MTTADFRAKTPFLLALGVTLACFSPDQMSLRAHEHVASLEIAPGLSLLNRTVTADAALPLPATGQAFYVFTSRALLPEQLPPLRASSLRHLGAAGKYCYAFMRNDGTSDGDGAPLSDEDLRAALRSTDRVVGTALVESRDRVDPELLPWLSEDNNVPLPGRLAVIFWQGATRAEVEDLLGTDADAMQLPSAPDAELNYENKTNLVATPAMLRKYAASPAIARLLPLGDIEICNADSRLASGVNTVAAAPYSLDGAGVLVSIWDGGNVYAAHGDFGGRVTNIEAATVNYHATHVSGTICGSGAGNALAKGMAPGCTIKAYSFTDNAGDPLDERRLALHNNYHELDNHSWGSTAGLFTPSQRGIYDARSVKFDDDARDLLLTACKSAGNTGIVAGDVPDSLVGDSTAKNIIAISVLKEDKTFDTRGSQGPANDGRMKPDVSAIGISQFSTMDTAPSNGGTPLYDTLDGSSQAGPVGTGVLTLLAQLHKARLNGQRMKADVSRALLIHGAEDNGPTAPVVGPDYKTGHGMVSAQAPADIIIAEAANLGKRIIRGSVRDTETKSYTMTIPAATASAKATLVWLDPASTTAAAVNLVNNLDLELVEPNGTIIHYPWSLSFATPSAAPTRTAANTRDNAEVTLVSNPVAGDWTIRVKGTDVTTATLPDQGFVLITSHNVTRTVERLTPTVAIPANGTALTSAQNLTLTSAAAGTVSAIRVFVDVQHTARGQVAITLTAPDATVVNLETTDADTRDDIFAIYPDTRPAAASMAGLVGKTILGNWTLNVSGTGAGTLRYAMIEIESSAGGPPANNAPTITVAAAANPSPVDEGVVCTLSVTASDPDGDPITYLWTKTSGPAVTIINSTTAAATFTAPAVAANTPMSFQVAVTDSNSATTTSTVNVTVNDVGGPPPVNSAPVITNTTGTTTSLLSGAGGTLTVLATDADGDPMTYSWTWIGGPVPAITSPTASSSPFTAPVVVGTQNMTLRITVSDNQGNSTSVDVVVQVSDGSGGGNDPLGTGGGCTLLGGNVTRLSGLLLLAVAACIVFARRRRRKSS